MSYFPVETSPQEAPVRRRSIATIPEKELLLGDMDHLEFAPPTSHTRCRNLMIAVVAIAVLTTAIATGIGLTMFCDSTLKHYIQHLAPFSDSANLNHFARDLPVSLGVDASATVNPNLPPVTATRPPNKFYGPTVSPELAVALKISLGLNSIEKRLGVPKVPALVPVDNDVDNTETSTVVEKRAVWQPTPGTTWTYQLSETLSAAQLANAAMYKVWDIDLFDTNTTVIQGIQKAGSKVICYFSAGTVENWRSDSNQFKSADIGKPMGDWPGENWLNTGSANVRKIMAARLDLAKNKGCDGVDPDNMDAYAHDTGFSLSQDTAVSYVTYLAKQAASRGLAISLKNAGDIIPRVINVVQYSVEEACTAYSECDLYKPFTDAGKAVFHVEYPKGYGTVNTTPVPSATASSICTCKGNYKLSPIIKNNNLDSWQQACPQ